MWTLASSLSKLKSSKLSIPANFLSRLVHMPTSANKLSLEILEHLPSCPPVSFVSWPLRVSVSPVLRVFVTVSDLKADCTMDVFDQIY